MRRFAGLQEKFAKDMNFSCGHNMRGPWCMMQGELRGVDSGVTATSESEAMGAGHKFIAERSIPFAGKAKLSLHYQLNS